MTGLDSLVNPASRTATPSGAESDEEIFVRFRNGGAAQDFETLAIRHQGFAYRVAMAVCDNAAVAEEAVQESFLWLLRERVSFEPRGAGSFKAWLYKLVRRTTKDRRNAEQRIKMRTHNPFLRDRGDVKESSSPGWEEETADRERLLQEVRRSLSDLGEELRLPLVLHFLEGLSQGEVARIAGISQSQVSRRIEQALEQLRRRMTHSGVALPAAGIPALLQHPELVPVPPGLEAALKGFLAAAVATRESLRIAATTKPASSLWFWWAGLAMLPFAAGGAWWWASRSPDGPVERSPAARTEREPGQLPLAFEGEPLFARWSAADGSLSRMEVRRGAWTLDQIEVQGKTRWFMDSKGDGVWLVLPPRLAPRPYLVRIRYAGGTPRQYGRLRRSGIGWMSSELMIPHLSWTKPLMPTPLEPYEHRFLLVDRYLLGLDAEGGGVNAVKRYDVAYPGDRLVLFFQRRLVEEISLKSLSMEEARALCHDPEALIALWASPPTHVPSEALPEPKPRP